MSTQDKLEGILREIHVLISKSDVYNRTENKIIVDKKTMFELLNRLNVCIYEIMDEYEMTKQSRDKAERDARKRGDEIIFNASRQAEDIYAASILYTNEALLHIQNIMQDAAESVETVFTGMQESMKKEKQIVRDNQSELKGQLQDMIDMEKYLRLIEERNKQIEKEREAEKNGMVVKSKEPSSYAAVKPEIKINTEYFEKIGKPLETPDKAADTETEIRADAEQTTDFQADDDLDLIDLPPDTGEVKEFSSIEEAVAEVTPEKKASIASKVKINLDSDYFKWLKNKEKKQP